MPLRDYLHLNRITVADFASKLGFARTYLSSINTGRIRPSMKLARMIEKETGGQVTALELIL